MTGGDDSNDVIEQLCELHRRQVPLSAELVRALEAGDDQRANQLLQQITELRREAESLIGEDAT